MYIRRARLQSAIMFRK